MNENIYIIFSDVAYEQAGGAYDSLGVFGSLEAAQDHCKSTMIETDWDYQFFDTLEEVKAYHEKVGDGEYSQRVCGDYRHKVYSERSTLNHIYRGELYIATIKDGQLVVCSEYISHEGNGIYRWKNKEF